MATIWQDIKQQFTQGNAIVRLVMLNIAVYVITNMISVPLYLSGIHYGLYVNFLEEWFYLPSSPMKLLLRPWTIFTYMFMHANFWHLLFNMLVLYGFGRITNDLIHNSKIIPLYLLGGMAGALLFMISFNIFPVFLQLGSVPLVGASASVMGILLSAATLNPHGHIRLIILGSIELQYVALALVVIDILSIPLTNPGGHFAHLGGAFMGWFYIYQLRRGRDLGQPFIVIANFLRNTFAGRQEEIRKKRQPKMVYKKAHQPGAAETGSTGTTTSYNTYSRSFAQRYRNMTQEECLDAILEKIHKEGYDSLSEEEKAFLYNSSKKK
jgi:membrane associated rhomboid family serine protease